MSRMAGTARTPRVKLTYEDFVRFPDDGMRHELIDGEHYVTPSPNIGHQRVVGQLYGLIWTYLRTRPVGELFVAPFDVVFSNVDVVEPDLLYVSQGRASILTQANVKGTPDLVVEVRSPSTGRRDETIKLALYERAGVSEYWLVDPRGLEVTFDILRHTEKGYVATRKQRGWVKSAVFGKSFRLTRRDDEEGVPLFTLEVR